jgi:hypothetical protein
VSLIDEALRRAQAAQTSSAANARGLRVPMPLPDSGRYRRRRALRLTAGALAVAVLAGGAFFLLRGQRRDAPPRGVAPDASTSSSSSASGLAGAAPTLTETPAPGGSAAPPAARASAQSGVAATPTEALPPGIPAPPGAAAPEPTPTATPAPDAVVAPTPRRPPLRREPPRTPLILPPVEVSDASASPRVAGDERPPGMEPMPEPPPRVKTYHGTANLPSARLELEGIVYSEGGAKALINGRVVGPGGYVEGYTVVRIERDRVELEGDDGNVILTLK